jgi:hypothetical protein
MESASGIVSRWALVRIQPASFQGSSTIRGEILGAGWKRGGRHEVALTRAGVLAVPGRRSFFKLSIPSRRYKCYRRIITVLGRWLRPGWWASVRFAAGILGIVLCELTGHSACVDVPGGLGGEASFS